MVSRYARPWRTRAPLDDAEGFVDDLMALGHEADEESTSHGWFHRVIPG